MLNVGPLELLVVLAVALIVVGPERLPELARSVGRALRQFREVQDEVRDMVSSGVDDEMREAAAEFRKATGSIKRATDVKGAVRRAERTIREETAGPRAPQAEPGGSQRGEPTEAAAPQAEPGGSQRGEPTEAAGPPADRLVVDPAAERPAAPPAEGADPTGSAAPEGSESPPEP